MENYEKLYKDALEKARDFHTKCINGKGIVFLNEKSLEDMFPVLKEDEDEKIRKGLITYFDCLASNKKYCIDKNRTLKVSSILAWLEKQSEKIDAIETFDTEFEKQVSHLIASAINKEYEYNQGYVKWAANALLNYAKYEFEKQGEQKSIEEIDGEDYGIDGLWHAVRILETTLGEVEGYQSDDGILEHKAAITAVKKLKEQKPVEWSNADMAMLDCIMTILCEEEKYEENKRQIEWLKSIKGKAFPQLRQCWCDEDEEIKEALVSRILENYNGCSYIKGISEDRVIDWLKSLRPQKPWLPTLQQLEAIRVAATVGTANHSWAMDKLKEMYKQLTNDPLV